MTSRIPFALALVVASALASSSALAHPGGVDERGCHVDTKTGKSHCHRKSEVRKAAPSGKWCVPAWDSEGRIKRDSRQRRAFVEANPCPATKSRDANKSCPGYHVDHVVPLACCGPDDLSNMAWTPAKENLSKGAKCPWDPPRRQRSR